MRSNECVHGSLLVIAEIFRAHPPLINTKYEMICQKIFKIRDHPNRYVKQGVIEIIPFMAKYRVETFCQKFGNTAIQYILGVVKKDADKVCNPAYAALAKIVRIVGSTFLQPYVEQMLQLIQQTLSYAKGKPHVPEALTCLASICTVVNEYAVEQQVVALMDDIFKWPLTITLAEALAEISPAFPTLVRQFQKKLLNTISLALCTAPFGCGPATYASGYDRTRAITAMGPLVPAFSPVHQTRPDAQVPLLPLHNGVSLRPLLQPLVPLRRTL